MTSRQGAHVNGDSRRLRIATLFHFRGLTSAAKGGVALAVLNSRRRIPVCVAGVVNSNYGICQDRNPFELRREFLPDLAKRMFRDVSRVSCARTAN